MADDGLEFQQAVTTTPTPTVEPSAAVAVETPAPVVEPHVEVPQPPPVVETLDPHPLEPGGTRFRQVYARAKTAEEQARELAAQIQAVREDNIRLDTELKLLREGRTQPNEQEYSWVEFEAAIAEGRITRATAMNQWSRQVEAKTERKVQAQIDATTRRQAVSYDLTRYSNSVPDLRNPGTEVRQRVDQEFDYLMGVQGRDPRTLTQDERRSFELVAVRNVLGPVESLNQNRRPTVQSHSETSGSQNKPVPRANPDQAILDGLKPEQVTYYKQQIHQGLYKNWAEVVAELKFTPPQGSPFRPRA